MYAGKPVVASRVKGHVDLVTDGEGGFLYPWNDRESFCERILALAGDKELRSRMGAENRRLVKGYAREKVFSQVLGAMTMEEAGGETLRRETSARR